MASLEETYLNILLANNVKDPKYNCKNLKRLLFSNISGIEFHKPKKVNESERVTMKNVRDAAIQLTENSVVDAEAEMKVLYEAASVLRKAIHKCEPWKFSGSLDIYEVTEEHLPKQLYSVFRWILQGPNKTLSSDTKASEFNRRALSLGQTTVSMFLSDRQVGNKKSKMVRFKREMPQQLAVGISMHQAFRSKKAINLLHGFGMSVEYNRILRLENQIANSVMRQMLLNDGLYIPPEIVQGRHMFFAIANSDFAEDTPDGKRTLHATAMAVYQKSESWDSPQVLKLSGKAYHRSIQDLPHTITNLQTVQSLLLDLQILYFHPTTFMEHHINLISSYQIVPGFWVVL